MSRISRRLVDRFALSEQVEIRFQGHEQWFAGHVVAHQHPGVWVQLMQGGRYFVTNSQRIRPKTAVYSAHQVHPPDSSLTNSLL